MEPGGKARAPVEAVSRFIEPDERLLRHVARVGLVADDRAGKPVGARLMPLDQEVEGLGIALRNPPAQLLIGRLHRHRFHPVTNSASRPPRCESAARRRNLPPAGRRADATLPDAFDESPGSSVYTI